MQKQPSCGFGQKIDKFFVNVNSTALNPSVRNCLGNSVYGPEDATFIKGGYPPDIQKNMAFGSSLKKDLAFLEKLKCKR